MGSCSKHIEKLSSALIHLGSCTSLVKQLMQQSHLLPLNKAKKVIVFMNDFPAFLFPLSSPTSWQGVTEWH